MTKYLNTKTQKNYFKYFEVLTGEARRDIAQRDEGTVK